MLLACLALAPGASAKGIPYHGVQLSPSTLGGDSEFDTKQLDLAKQLGANVVKVDTLWSALEPASKGEFDDSYLTRIDALVNGAASRGMKTVLLFRSSPCWASSAPADKKAGCKSVDEFGPYPPTNVADYADTLSFLVKRFGSSKLAGVEVWNEPDHENEFYWAGGDKAKNYATLLKAAYPAVKKADSKVLVLGGSLVGSAGKFLAELYKYGAKGSYDALSVHFYNLVLASVRSIQVVQKKHGDRAKLWLSEFGWDTCAGKTEGGHECVSKQLQGRNIADVMAAFRGKSYLQGAVVYNLLDQDGYSFGLADLGFNTKPGFSAVKKAFTNPGRPRRVTLKVSGGVARGTAPAGDVVVVTGYRSDGSQAFQNVAVLDAGNHYAVRVTGGATRVVAEQPWTKRRASARA